MHTTATEAAAKLREGWMGQTGGPIQTVQLLVASGGYFEVPHLLMTYVEYLAGLNSGKGPDVKYTDVRDFFDAYFGKAYEYAAAWLIYQYRHGLVHTFAPKVIRLEDGTEVGWHCDLRQGDGANHLRVLPRENSADCNLRVYAVRLLNDFKNAVAQFADAVESDPAVFERVQSGHSAYEEAIPINSISKPYVRETDKQWLRESASCGSPRVDDGGAGAP